MKVYWLNRSGRDVPEDDSWLSDAELTVVHSLRIAKRRNDWRLGRWTAKRALAALLEIPLYDLSSLSVLATASGAPEVLAAGSALNLALSISHREGLALCAIVLPDGPVGCDLEFIEPHSDAFGADYFTADEQALVARSSDRDLLLTLLWSAKESALKAMHTGLRLDTRDVQVDFCGRATVRTSSGWDAFRVQTSAGGLFYGWWQCSDGMVQTVVTARESSQPTLLPLTASVEAAARPLSLLYSS